jgi:anti-sigma B factor antagonist
MDVSKSSFSNIPLLVITGEVDHLSAPYLQQQIQQALDDEGPNLLIDLSNCAYLDSGGLSVVLSTVRRQRGTGWLGVVGSNANLVRLFRIVGLNGELGFHVFAGFADVSTFLKGS